MRTSVLLLGSLCWFMATQSAGRALPPATPFQIVHQGFEDFSQGQMGNAGQNLYGSRSGRLQLINRWDLNNDGYYDLVFANTHNVMLGSIDALGYLQTQRGFRSAISPIHKSIALYDQWLQEEKSRATTIRLPVQLPTAALFYDLDGDGYDDILFASSRETDPFSESPVYWGDESGFRHHNWIKLPTVAATDVAVGDLNGDGYQELVYANRGHARAPEGSYLYWGSPDRHSPRQRTTIATSTALSCAIGDLDGDGHSELIFAHSPDRQDTLLVYPGRETGPDLDAPQSIPVPSLKSVRFVNRPDLGSGVLATSEKDIRLFTLEVGRLRGRTLIQSGATRATLADLDGDGKSDLVAAGGDESAILWGRDDWSRESATRLPTLQAQDLAVGDLNGDGRPEVVFANNRQGTHGDMDVPSYLYWGKPWGYGPENRTDLQTFGAAAVAIGDLNRDGRPDLLFGNTASGINGGKNEDVFVYWGRAHRGYSPAHMSRYPCVMGMATSLADLDDDGHTELLVANSGRHYSGLPGASYIYWGSATGPSLQQRSDFPLQEAGSFSIADLNRDGFLDAVAFDYDTLAFLWGGPKGISKQPERLEKVAESGQNARLVDFDHDGWLDIVAGNVRGQRTRILLGGPQGYSLQRSLWLPQAHAGNMEFADLNADGHLDMLLARSYSWKDGVVDRNDSWLKIFFGREHGFGSEADREFPTAGAFDLSVADLNGDGHLDIAVSQYASRTRRNLPLVIFWNDGQGDFSERHRSELPAESSAGLLAADFDEDGHLDLLVNNHKLTYKEDHHTADSFLYWGARSGFSVDNKTHLPAHGPHFMQNVDVGNLKTRKPEEYYTSVPIQIPEGVLKWSLTYQAETPHGSEVRFEVRSASARDALPQQAWRSVSHSGAFDAEGNHLWLQYRATLVAGRGYASPYLTQVTIGSQASVAAGWGRIIHD